MPANQVIDHLVIGSGIAGLSLALKLAERDSVYLIAKRSVVESNSWYAQGGIASVLNVDDSFASHASDTIVAGAGLCHTEIVDLVVQGGPRAISELAALGCKFTESESRNGWHLTQEGGHSNRRVIHANDLTGKEVIQTLLQKVKEHPRITLADHQIAVDLITTDKYSPDFSSNRCVGAYVFDRSTGGVSRMIANRVYLCTGGHGRLYLYTSNPNVATGDGLAMGYRAGCKVANLEFMQFHPTCLYHPKATRFLISEALRGEGGVLRNRKGDEFVKAWHPDGSLAPRDIVARAIDSELKTSGDTNVFLDVTHLGERNQSLFPNIYKFLQSLDIDMARDLIPVVPAAHYSCGGLVVDEWGRTGVQGVYAVGETACTGLHGANRLASNSLLEALVFADRVSEKVLSEPMERSITTAMIDSVPDWNPGKAMPADNFGVLSHAWDEIRRLMWHFVGIVRSDSRLARALKRIEVIRRELDEYYWSYELNEEILELRNLALIGSLTIRCAMARKESRGIHYNIDYPDRNDRFECKDTILH